jgi:3-oxoacyl-[acyl-carrier protein] reductase
VELALSGSKAIVAGASRGIGLAVAQLLRQEGASVAICARDTGSLEDARATLEGVVAQGAVFARPADLANAKGTRAFVREAIEALGGLDIYIHNASAFGSPTDEGWARSFEIDVISAVRGIEAARPALDTSENASIVLVGSTASIQWFPRPTVTGYGAAKAAQRVLVNELAQTLGRQRIRANTVSPGSTIWEGSTWDKLREENPDLWQGLIHQFPFRRLLSLEEVARVVTFVASPAASGINGTHVIVDGGQNKAVQ